jgi:hypothetical protein
MGEPLEVVMGKPGLPNGPWLEKREDKQEAGTFHDGI